MTDYDYRNCQSLFGYAAKVHERSGGVCQLCGAGSVELDFDLWRQMTVEHLIGESQGGYLRQISASLARRFPGLDPAVLAEFAGQIEAANTVTACSFCNSTTSRAQAPASMTSLIEESDGTPEQLLDHVAAGLDSILAGKRRAVAWKLAAVRKAFDSEVVPRLGAARVARVPVSRAAVGESDVRIVVERITSDVVAAPSEFVTPPGYAHLSLALVDAVYSIRSRYSAVQRVVAAYGQASATGCQPLAVRSEPGFSERGLDCLVDRVGILCGQELADLLFAGSRSRTAGRLKADVCVEVAGRLQAMSVTHVPDLRERSADAEVRHAWTGVHGLGWVTWQCFCSLVEESNQEPTTAGAKHSKPLPAAIMPRPCH